MSEVHKDWKSVLEVYAGHPHDAFILAQLLKQLKEHVEGGPSGRRETLAQLEFAIRTLHQYTGFNKVSRSYIGLQSLENSPVSIMRNCASLA